MTVETERLMIVTVSKMFVTFSHVLRTPLPSYNVTSLSDAHLWFCVFLCYVITQGLFLMDEL